MTRPPAWRSCRPTTTPSSPTPRTRETGPLGSIISTGRDVIYTFEVAEAVKGDIGQRVDLRSAASGMSCGFEVPAGQAIGILLDRRSGMWRSGLCGQIEPGKLRAAAAPLPAPDGRGPTAFIVGGSSGEARLMALDRQARTLAYGHGTGLTTQLSICPGGRRVLELVGDRPRPPRVALRELPSLGLVWERRLPRQPPSVEAQSVRCLDHNGIAYVVASNGGDPSWSPQATLLRVSRTTTTKLYQGAARSIAFGSDVGYVNDERRGSRPSQAVIIDLKPSPPQVRTTILGPTTQTVPGNMVWLDHDRIGFFPWSGDNARAIIFDRPLHELGGINNWSAWTSLLVGDVTIGVGQGRLSMADLPNGPARVLQQFESPQTIALAALPGITLVPAPHVAPLATGDADLPILPLAAGAAAIALLAAVYFVGRARRRTSADA